MHRSLPIFVLFLFGFSLFSCRSNNSNDHSAVGHKSEQEEHITKDDSIALSENKSEVIELNGGEKWLINEEMKPFIAQGESAVNDYIANNEQDYHALAKELKDADSKLISSCTMEGKSHDELHKWLHPHLELVEELDKAPNEAEANTVVNKLKKSYDTFWVYFQ